MGGSRPGSDALPAWPVSRPRSSPRPCNKYSRLRHQPHASPVRRFCAWLPFGRRGDGSNDLAPYHAGILSRRKGATQPFGRGTMRRRSWSAVVLTTGLMLCTSAVAAQAAVPTDTGALREAVTVEGVLAHMAEFQEFADLSDGTREASTLGYQLSADYVAGLMEAAGYEVTRQPFEYNFYEELAAADRHGHVAGLPVHLHRRREHLDDGLLGQRHGVRGGAGRQRQHRAAAGRASRTAPRTPAVRTPTSPGFTGDIALIQRGTCFFSREDRQRGGGRRRRGDHLQRGQQPGALGHRLRSGQLPAGRPGDRDERRGGGRSGRVHRGRGGRRSSGDA